MAERAETAQPQPCGERDEAACSNQRYSRGFCWTQWLRVGTILETEMVLQTSLQTIQSWQLHCNKPGSNSMQKGDSETLDIPNGAEMATTLMQMIGGNILIRMCSSESIH